MQTQESADALFHGKVILSWPKHLANAAEVQKGSGPRRSWIQLAKTGSFQSNRYGKFSITKTDLTQMLHNWNEVTPLKPTELPIDYDHLSMDPKKPGDGVAAGWMKNLELREDGDELWAEVEWTPTGAERIEANEYRFVSPSFVKDHTHKDGKKIGTTLLAAAITNHPFLEGMSALTLYNCSAMGDLAVDLTQTASLVTNLAEIGQRVMIAPGHARTMDEVGGSFEIVEVVGQGDDAFCKLKDANGAVHEWFRSTDLLPSSATPMPGAPPLQPGVPNPDKQGAAATPEAMAQVEAAATEAKAQAAAAGATPEEQEVAAQAAREQAQAALAAAAPAVDPNAAVDPNDPAAVAAAAAAGATADKPASTAKGEEEEKPKADAKVDVTAEKTVEVQKKTSENGAPVEKDDEDPLKKVVGALMGAKPAKKVTNMATKFMLRNDKNEEVEVTQEQLEKAGIRIVPEGSTVIGEKELGDLQGKVTNLSSQVETLATATATAQKAAAKMQLSQDLDRLSNGGFITKPMRDYAEKKWGESTDLTDFNEWKAQFTTAIVSLNKVHGSSVEGDETKAGEEAGKQLISLANTIARERNISLRDAMIQASAQMPEQAETYRESFAS